MRPDIILPVEMPPKEENREPARESRGPIGRDRCSGVRNRTSHRVGGEKADDTIERIDRIKIIVQIAGALANAKIPRAQT